MTLDARRLDDLLRWHQSGVVARRQILELGGTDADIARLLRRRDLVVVHPDVYVNHTGGLATIQQQWVAVLARWPAALVRESALREQGGGVIHLAVDRHRHIDPLPGVEIHRVTDLKGRTDWRTTPPQIRASEAVIDTMVARLDEDDVAAAFAVLARACFRRTNADRVARALAGPGRVPHRRMITAMLDDRRTGACSVLERGYLHWVERAHGLPRGTRQAQSTVTGARTDQDVRYEKFGVVVELDGRTHDAAATRDADAKRDLAELDYRGGDGPSDVWTGLPRALRDGPMDRSDPAKARLDRFAQTLPALSAVKCVMRCSASGFCLLSTAPTCRRSYSASSARSSSV